MTETHGETTACWLIASAARSPHPSEHSSARPGEIHPDLDPEFEVTDDHQRAVTERGPETHIVARPFMLLDLRCLNPSVRWRAGCPSQIPTGTRVPRRIEGSGCRRITRSWSIPPDRGVNAYKPVRTISGADVVYPTSLRTLGVTYADPPRQ
jgi:hypothetical protein